MKKYIYIIAASVILGSVSFSFSPHVLAIETGTTWTAIFGRPSIGNGSSGGAAAGASGGQAAGASGGVAGGFSNISGGNSGGAAAGSDSLLPNPIKADNIQDLIYLIISIVTYIGMILAILALIWVGFRFVAAQGNSEKLKDARKEFLYVVIGIAILIGAAAITDVIKTTLTSAGVVDNSFFTTTRK